jgi:DNA polymerase-3 subunit epsilon
MISRFRHKNHPAFWKAYQITFKNKTHSSFENTRFIVFDTETTGLNTSLSKILSIGAIGICGNKIDVSDSFEVYLKQDDFNPKTVEIHGILKEGKLEKLNEVDAIEKFIEFIKNGVLIAHHASFDIEMINAALKRMSLPKLKNKSIDTGVLYKKLQGKKDSHFSLDLLCDEFGIPKHDRHTASGDAYITALLFLKIISKLKKERTLHYSDLFKKQHKKSLL